MPAVTARCAAQGAGAVAGTSTKRRAGLGSPPTLSAGAGVPTTVTVKLPATLAERRRVHAGETPGALFTVSVNACAALEPTLLAAVKVSA